MLISCPTCPKRYNIPASEIPSEGRDVRCANCGTVWHEKAEVAEIVDVMAPQTLETEDALHLLTRILHDQVAEARDTMAEIAALEDQQSRDNRPALPSYHESADEEETIAPVSSTALIVTNERTTDIVTHANDSVEADRREEPMDDRNAEKEVSQPAEIISDPAPLPVVHKQKVRAVVDRVRLHWSEWREAKARAQRVPPGNAAAQSFRDRARSKYRNRLTPLRAVGWLAYAASVAALSVGFFSFRDTIEETFPASTNLYARLSPPPERPLTVTGLSTRYVQSLSGPVLEIRGSVQNIGREAAVPAMELTAITPEGAVPQPVSITDVPLPSGGSRPFVVRAQLPPSSTRAVIEVNPASTKMAKDRYVYHQTGRGWSERR